MSAREARILKACSEKEQSGFSDDEISEVTQKTKATLLANLATLSINSLMPLINHSKVGGLFLYGIPINNYTKQDNGNGLTIFGKIIKGDFTGNEFDEFFTLVKTRGEYIDGKIDDFSDEKESRLNELVKKARGIIIGKIEPLEGIAIFTDIKNALGESE